MRILTLHSDFIEFEPLTKAIGSAEECDKAKKRIAECLVAFATVEKADEADELQVAQNAAKEIMDVAAQVKSNSIVLYPFVHLSSTPSSPSSALNVLKLTESELKAKGFVVDRAPFGWYKSFDIKVKGHPLSELSREIKPVESKKESGEKMTVSGGPVSDSLKKEAEMKSKFYILTPKGELVEAEKYKYSPDGKNLKKFADYEIHKKRAYEMEPPHIKLMKEQKIADYEPGSDSGNFRWYPKGRLMKKLLERQITEYCTDYGSVEVETPIMYDFEHPALKKYLSRFPARQYVVKSDEKEFFLRFSACFGQFLMAHDMVISYKDLPFRMFELTRYSFRREQSGELAGLKRVRALTMPDMHAFCADLPQAKTEFEAQYQKALEWISMLGLEYEVGFRIQKEFFDQNRDWYMGMVKKFGRPILVEMFDVRYAYFITKFEFNFVDALDKASALSTVQIDVENADTYDIWYTAADGSKKRPIITHASISGSIERIVYALLEQQAMRIREGKPPIFPLWLSPTQVRVVPVADRHNKFAEEVAEQLELNAIRADVDDRTETLQKKIRAAEQEWVPFIVVVGDKEAESKKLSVRVRGTKESPQMAIEELTVLIRKKTDNFPHEKLTLPRLLSKRPIFRG